jgi:DNA-binding transcriptional ArsR family regulator
MIVILQKSSAKSIRLSGDREPVKQAKTIYRKITILEFINADIYFVHRRIHCRHIIMDIDAIHKALANPVRRQILAWLKTPGEYFAQQEYPLDLGVCAGLIDQRAGLSQSTVSAHLATLQRAELVTSKRVGQWIFFKRNEKTIQAFLEHIHGGL